MQFFYPDTPDVPLPEGHRFPAGKYRMARERIVAEGILGAARLSPSPAATIDELHHAHEAGYVAAVLRGTLPKDIIRRIGLPWSQTLALRSRITVGGSLAAARAALVHGVSGQLAGGTHHAHRDFGSGFCVFNDLAVAAKVLLAEQAVRRIAILDTDVHQGDGNAALLASDPNTFVVSMHGEKNFPFRKVASDLDIALPDGTDDGNFLDALEGALSEIEKFGPDLLLYLSGADPLADDSLGRLAMTHDGLMARDHRVFTYCRYRNLPVAIVLGGGYCRPIDPTVVAYVNTFRVLADVYGL
jgi:acetoin utilization deacetylase AcuC-like enzyme